MFKFAACFQTVSTTSKIKPQSSLHRAIYKSLQSDEPHEPPRYFLISEGYSRPEN